MELTKRAFLIVLGPKAQASLARNAATLSPSYPRAYPFVMDHGRGAEVSDVDGNRFSIGPRASPSARPATCTTR